MAVAFSDLIKLPTKKQIKDELLAIATAAGLPATSWVLGDNSERWIELTARALDRFLSSITTQAIRAFFLERATDPGDPGDLSADQTPRGGWLSALGEGWYGTTRGGATYPTGFVTVTNAGSSPATFAPFDLTFQRSTAATDGGFPTYRNTQDGGIYVGFGGTLTLAPGASATIPIQGEQLGTYGSATGEQISVVVTQSFGALTCTNGSAVLGSAREERSLYVTRCKQAASAASPHGCADAYRYAATTGRDGTILQRYDGSGLVGTTKVFVLDSAPDGTVLGYLADNDGPVDAVDLSSANANMTGISLGVITRPIGVLPKAVTILPTATDPGTGGPGFAAAIATDIGPLVGTARINAVLGVSALELVAAAQAAILDKLSGAGDFADAGTFPAIPIGGYDQTAGAGTVATSDLADDVRDAYPGLRSVALTVPSGSTTAIALGHVARLKTLPAISGAANDGGGGIEITTASAHGLSTGNTVQIYDVLGTLEANGTWVITSTGASSFTLDGSTFVTPWVSGGRISRIVITVVA